MISLMIVDDDPDVCRFAKSFFEMRGLRIYTAPSGEEALKILTEEKPHLMLIDVKMGGMDGVALLKEVKKRHPAIEAIMVSAIEDLDVVQEAKRHGAHQYITKPLILEDLERVVMEKVQWIEMNTRT